MKDQSQGWMSHLKLEEAKKRWGNKLRIAALGAIETRPGPAEVRVIFDATHGVLANNHIRVQDQLAFPQAGDIQALMHELSKLGAACFFLIYDFSSAHRLVPVRYEDWGFQDCRLEGDVDAEGNEMVWINKVRTFGFASAAYCWARLGVQ